MLSVWLLGGGPLHSVPQWRHLAGAGGALRRRRQRQRQRQHRQRVVLLAGAGAVSPRRLAGRRFRFLLEVSFENKLRSTTSGTLLLDSHHVAKISGAHIRTHGLWI